MGQKDQADQRDLVVRTDQLSQIDLENLAIPVALEDPEDQGVQVGLEDLEDLEDPLFQKFPETQEVSSTQFGYNLIYLMDY